MEYSLLSPHNIILKKQGIPYNIIEHLIINRKFHDSNLQKGFGIDKDLKEINHMEEMLGNLAAEQIDRRIATDCCCIWRYDYPQRVHDICALIGGRPHTATRLHYQVCPARRQEFIDYADALQGWLRDIPPDDDCYSSAAQATIQKVYQFLGAKDPLKELLVERTYYGLSARFLNCSFWGNNADGSETHLYPYTAQQLPADWPRKMAALEQSIQEEMGSGSADFLCEVGGAAEPACHFKFIRRVDILVSSIGCLRWRGNLPPKDGTVKGRRQLTRLYLDILEKYWRGTQVTPTDSERQQLQSELFELLGEPSDFKRWLVASLWKSIRNQTEYSAYPMRRWVEFVRIGEEYLAHL